MSLYERVKKISHAIEIDHRMTPLFQEIRGFQEFGIFVKDGIIVWEKMPDNEENDDQFVTSLVKKAQEEGARI